MRLISIAEEWGRAGWQREEGKQAGARAEIHDHIAGLHGALNRFAVGIAASLVQKQALLQDWAGKLFHHPRLLEHTALEPALELPCRSDSTIGKGHERSRQVRSEQIAAGKQDAR